MTLPPAMGPVALCTLVATDGRLLAEAYTGWLHQAVSRSEPLDQDTAATLGLPELAGRPSWILANAAGREWLQLVEYPGVPQRDALGTHGWMALEVLVDAVDELAASLEDSPFELLRPPADLDVSDKIRACQVRGPAGEILYLTQVKGQVPPFQLPRCEAPVDHLFIPVLSTPSRERSLADYATISGNEGILFDTKITVVNQSRGFGLERRHPVATLQLAGDALIEIDEIAGTSTPGAGVHSGMACVTFHCAQAADSKSRLCAAGPFSGRATSTHTGSAGEQFALLHP